MKISVVTPSFKQHDWLRLCAASVADQQGADLEHIVQDAGGPPEAQAALQAWARGMPRLQLVVEKDRGMYDAINRGLRRAQGEVCCYLNCDEQYLPGALARVARHFEARPGLDVLLTDSIVVLPDGAYLCDRKSLTPQKAHSMVSNNLAFLTCSLFFRRRILERNGLFFSDQFRGLGDADWAVRAVDAGVRMEVLRGFTSVFSETGDNLLYNPACQREFDVMKAAAPAWARLLRPAVIAHFRLRRLLAGGYFQAPYEYSIYTRDNPAQRKTFQVPRPTHRWIRTGPNQPPPP